MKAQQPVVSIGTIVNVGKFQGTVEKITKDGVILNIKGNLVALDKKVIEKAIVSE